MSSVTECFLRKVMPIKMFTIVSKTKNVSSNFFLAVPKYSVTCFLTRTVLPLEIWILNLGGSNSRSNASGRAVGVFRSSFPESALWTALEFRRPKFLQFLYCGNTHNIRWLLFKFNVFVSSLISYFSVFSVVLWVNYIFPWVIFLLSLWLWLMLDWVWLHSISAPINARTLIPSSVEVLIGFLPDWLSLSVMW